MSANCNYGAFNIPGASNCTNPSSKFTNGFIGSKDMGGWVLGWGTEYALTSHWSAKGEADYIGFGNRNIVANDPINGATPVTGGIVLKSVSGAMIVVNETGIYISNGQGAMITLIGPAVEVNLGALTVI